MASGVVADRARSSYISGPLADHAWIILCPVLALAAMYAVWTWSGVSDRTIYAILFALIVTGHHMPGWLRAFGEPTVYARHKARLWVSVFAIPTLVVVPTYFGFGMIALCVAAVFDLWHVARQQHGFGRIYGAKAGDVARSSARLDLACILTWYTTIVVWSDAWMQAIASSLRAAGLDVFSALTPQSFFACRLVFMVASVLLLAGYLIVAIRGWRANGEIAAHKHLVHAVAFSVLAISYQDPSWFRANAVQNLFHAVQYFFMVWIFGRLTIQRGVDHPGAFYRSLFATRLGILPYAALITAYGYGALLLAVSSYRLRESSEALNLDLQLLGSIGIASLLLHFYVDSFIWKVRTKQVQTTLDIQQTTIPEPIAPLRLPSDQLKGALHALLYFGIPTLAVALLGMGARDIGPEQRNRALAHDAALFPRSVVALAAHGEAARMAGDLDTATREFEAAIALAPYYDGPARSLAELAGERGDRDAELEYLRLAVRAEPQNDVLLFQLAVLEFSNGNIDETEQLYERLLSVRPDSAAAHVNLGVLYRTRDLPEQALPHFRRAHEIDPDLSPAACKYASTLATLDRSDEALRVLEAYRSRHPTDTTAARLHAAIRSRQVQEPRRD